MELFCNKCNTKLTREALTKFEGKAFNYADKNELLPKGTFALAVDAGFIFNIPIEYLAHTESLLLKKHPDGKGLDGCCGPGNFGQLNQVCPDCSQEIGVKIADCWTPRFIGIDGNKISKNPLW